MPAPKHLEHYPADTPPRFTRTARHATEKNVYGLAVNRGYSLLRQPGAPGQWRLRNRKTGRILREGSTLSELRRFLRGRKTTTHKTRERKHGCTLTPHPWTLTR